MKIGYSKTYPITSNGTWEKIWIEDEITGTEEDARKHLYSLKRQVENFHYESNKSEEKKQNEINSIQNTNGKHEVKIGITPEDINSCQTVKVLEQSYKYLVKNKPVLQEAYDKKYLELTKSQ